MKSLALSILLGLLAPPALALSCMPSNPAQSFNWMQESDNTFLVGHGQLIYKRHLPKNRDGAKTKALFSGKFLTRNGFTQQRSIPVTVKIECIGPWCPTFPTGKSPILAYIRKEGTKFTLTPSACGGVVFTDPKPKVLDQLRQCLISGSCKEKHLKAVHNEMYDFEYQNHN